MLSATKEIIFFNDHPWEFFFFFFFSKKIVPVCCAYRFSELFCRHQLQQYPADGHLNLIFFYYFIFPERVRIVPFSQVFNLVKIRPLEADVHHQLSTSEK